MRCPARRALPCSPCAALLTARCPALRSARASPCPAARASPCPAACVPPCPAACALPCPAARALPCPALLPARPAARALLCPAATTATTTTGTAATTQRLGEDSSSSISRRLYRRSSYANGLFGEAALVLELGINCVLESAAALGASESATSESAALAEALHTFTLDSGESRCFFRDCTTVTPLAAPVPVSLADPSGGPVVARASTVLPCQVVASSQVSASRQFVASCSCRVLSHQNLLWHHRLGHPSLLHLRSMHSRLLVSGLPRSLPPLPRSPAPPCLPCVEGRQRDAPHSSSCPPNTAPLHALHMDV
ncbi:unnamed protein product [Closterium sp. NIES-53]